MKKQNILISIAIVCLVIATILIVIFHIQNDNSKYLVELNYQELMNKFENEETFILFIGSRDCPHCISFKPTLTSALGEVKQEAYYIDVYPLDDAQREKLSSYVNYSGTPTVAFITNGKENRMRRLTGSQYTKEQILDRMEKAGFIQ